MKYGSIYKITNLINQKSYIGQTIKPIHKRWIEHKCNAKTSSTAISRAILKYGIGSFKIEEMCSCLDKEELNNKETYFINLYNCVVPLGYNIEILGQSGGARPDSVKKKISNKWTPERRAAMSNLHMGNTRQVGNTNKRFPILVTHIKNRISYAFEYSELAAKTIGLHVSGISVVLNGKRPHHKGFTFKELSDYEFKLFNNIPLEHFKSLAIPKERKNPVICIENLTGKTYKFDSCIEAAKALNLLDNEICSRLNGKRKGLHKGYRFLPA